MWLEKAFNPTKTVRHDKGKIWPVFTGEENPLGNSLNITYLLQAVFLAVRQSGHSREAKPFEVPKIGHSVGKFSARNL